MLVEVKRFDRFSCEFYSFQMTEAKINLEPEWALFQTPPTLGPFQSIRALLASWRCCFIFFRFPPASLFNSPFHSVPHVIICLPLSFFAMDISQIYATAAGGLFLAFILVNLTTPSVREWFSVFVSKHLTYPYFLRRHRLLGPWTRSGVLLQLVYVAMNAFCLGFRVSTLSKAGLRAGNLSLANMIPLFAGPHLAFLADVLGFRLGTYRQIHRSAGLMSFAHLLFHLLVVAVKRTSFSLKIPEHLYGTIVSPRYPCC